MDNPVHIDKMTITVECLYFSFVKDLIGLKSEFLVLPLNSLVSDLVLFLETKYSISLKNCLISVNLEIVDHSKVLKSLDSIGIIPPVSGG